MAIPTQDQRSTAVALVQAARAGDEQALEDVAAAAIAHALGVGTPPAGDDGGPDPDDYPALAAATETLLALAHAGAQMAAGNSEPAAAVREVADLTVAVAQVNSLLARGRDLGDIGLSLAASGDAS